MKGLLKIGWEDIFKGVVLSIIVLVIVYLVQTLKIDLTWIPVPIRDGLFALVGYIIKNLLTTDAGNVLGVEVVTKK